MLKPYDIAVKKLIEVFTNNIPVVGLQNEDGTDQAESVLTQIAKDSADDKVNFPIISVFRNPEVSITDGSQTKRASTSEGYAYTSEEDDSTAISLVAMRAKVTYTVDVFDVTRSSAEEIALKLFFRLRNNPEVPVVIDFPDFNHQELVKPELQLQDSIVNSRLNDKTKAQAYKIRFSFDLVGVNIFDLISRKWPELNYIVTVRLDTKTKVQ